MIKSTKAYFSRTLLLLISFALFCFLPGCGGSGTVGTGVAVTYTLAITTDVTTLKAGEIATITATVTDSTGAAASGQAVTFTLFQDKSGGTLAISGVGSTNSSGVVEAQYTAGAKDPTSEVKDIIQVSIPDSTKSVTITRSSGSEDAASLDLAASPTSIKTDGSTTSTITINALNAGNAIISGVTVNLSTDTGVLSAPSVTTPGTVTLSRGGNTAANKANRTATITATSTTTTGTVSAQIPVQIVGSTVTLLSDASAIATGTSASLTVTAKDAGGNAVSGATVNLTQSGTGSVTFGSETGTTNASGQFTTTASGNNNGTVTITATALGATATSALTITDASTVFSIDQQRLCPGAYPGTCAVVSGNPNPTAMQLNQKLELRVNAPGTIDNVVFATTTGIFTDAANAANTGSVITVAVDGSDKATAYLTTTQAGVATVNVYNAANSSTNDTLSVAMTSATADRITLQATPTIVPKSVGTTTGSSTLIAMVRDSSGYPVGNAPVFFTIVNPTGGGETISPVVVMSAATTTGGLNLGEARASFTSGSLPSGATGVQIRASVVGTTVATEAVGVDLTASGSDASIVIGGTAGSVAFGMAPELTYYDTGKTQYVQAMSVLVTDSNGNPAPAGTVISLSLWPIAWSTGSACSYDSDVICTAWSSSTHTDEYCTTWTRGNYGTFYNEDINENLILDAGEDGTRIYYDGTAAPVAGTIDGHITPVNSAAGSVPATVTTDASGVANFSLTYPLQSSIWTFVRIRASTIVQGTETVGQISFRLRAMTKDIGPPCYIMGSPYNF